MSDASEILARELLTALDEGRLAARDHVLRGNNPYLMGSASSTVKRILWDAGWIYVNGLPEKKS